jgi:outer membrane protein, heavy metal efflux system
MKIRLFTPLTILMVCLVPTTMFAAGLGVVPLTLPMVIELASDAPEVRLAGTRIAEGEARLAGARVRTLENPKLDLAAGPRSGSETSADVEVGVEIPIELGGRRSKRMALAKAGIEREKYATEDVRRLSVAAAVSAYFRVLQAEERRELARDRKTLADQLLASAQERHHAGDAPKFEVNLAQSEVARAASDIASTQSRIASARTSLARALGLPSGAGLQLAGNLKDRGFFDSILSAPHSPQRPDSLTALAEVEISRAAISLAEAETLPEVAFRVSYKREGSDNVVLGGFSVSLPWLNPRQAPVQEARVQFQRAQMTAEIRQDGIKAELEGARRAYQAAVESVRGMETDGLSLQLENQTLANESYRAGKINLSTLLQLRREALETRREYLEHLFEASEAGVELALAAGQWTTKYPKTN